MRQACCCRFSVKSLGKYPSHRIVIRSGRVILMDIYLEKVIPRSNRCDACIRSWDAVFIESAMTHSHRSKNMRSS